KAGLGGGAGTASRPPLTLVDRGDRLGRRPPSSAEHVGERELLPVAIGADHVALCVRGADGPGLEPAQPAVPIAVGDERTSAASALPRRIPEAFVPAPAGLAQPLVVAGHGPREAVDAVIPQWTLPMATTAEPGREVVGLRSAALAADRSLPDPGHARV